MFGSVLVANRGEIAVRVIRTLRGLGIRSVAVHSDADARAPHARLADESVRLGPAAPSESYLSLDRVIGAAHAAGAEAIHPGYGFHSESPAFARACAKAGIAFVGPPPEAMELLGDKVAAKRLAAEREVPILDGLARPGLADEEILEWAGAEPARLPLMVKAAAGGGGRGMRIVRDLDQLAGALAAARREALAGFGDDGLLVERYVERARHVEVQVLADAHGEAIHLGERECSLQRRHQKLLEESPSPAVGPELRGRLGSAALELARAGGYVGAGTVEFLVPYDDPGDFAFLELNARLQVEHPVTEAVTGLDLVECQLRIAAGEPLGITQAEVELDGHAIEVRVCAEDPAAGFLPATGTIAAYREPRGSGIRVDSGIELGTEVGASYDSLLLKLIAAGADRAEALTRLGRALDDLRLLGVTTNSGYLARLAAAPEVVAGELDTGLLERGVVEARPAPELGREAAVAAAVAERLETVALAGSDPWETLAGWRIGPDAPLRWRLDPVDGGERVEVTIGDARTGPEASVDGDPAIAVDASDLGDGVILLALDGTARRWDHAASGGERWVAAGPDAFGWRVVEPAVEGAAAVEGALEAPMPGSVLAVRVMEGDEVAEGDVLVVVESMKMELTIQAPGPATVVAIGVAEGDQVRQGQALVELEADSAKRRTGSDELTQSANGDSS